MIREKVRDPILDSLPNVSSLSSDSTSKIWSDSGLSLELKSDVTASCLFQVFEFLCLIFVCYFAAMSKRISLKKLGEKVEKSKNGRSVAVPTPAKGVVINEKRPREDLSSSLSKKGKAVDSPKGKKFATAPEPKKKATRPGDETCSRFTPSLKPEVGSSPSLGTVLGPGDSILGSLSRLGQTKARKQTTQMRKSQTK